MAKITIAGQAVVVTSTVKLEDLESVKKYRPEALTLYKGEGESREPEFAIAVNHGACGEISKYGACFGQANADGYAQLTMVASAESDELKEFVAEEIGRPILKLNELEATLPTIVAEIAAEKARILDNIRIVE